MPETYSTGHTCPYCGQWIGHGQSHYCTDHPQTAFYGTYHSEPDYTTLLERIAVVLEGILEELKRG
jgi:hypothetical protein